MLSQEGGMVSSVEESVEINCAVFLILIEVESAWKSEEAVFILSCLQRSIEKASQKTLRTLKRHKKLVNKHQNVTTYINNLRNHGYFCSYYTGKYNDFVFAPKMEGCSLNPDINYCKIFVNIWFLSMIF